MVLTWFKHIDSLLSSFTESKQQLLPLLYSPTSGYPAMLGPADIRISDLDGYGRYGY